MCRTLNFVIVNFFMKMKKMSTNNNKIFSTTGNFKYRFQTNFGLEILKNKYIIYWLYPLFYMEAKFGPSDKRIKKN